ncbi:FxLYD domain-containing protein [Pseudomonas aeruginosa]|uniref:FxLYD domain-containing protein n=1 Tax=Pseudomonas aeruginosa TaxID=287 RepID=UPI002244E284|nr:FxLYD domain-containing protein [Pseudomonas aeruginosa]
MKNLILSAILLTSSLAMANERVEVSDIQVVSNGTYSSITGVAKNISKVPIGNLFVKFKLYRGGEVVGNTLAHGADIGPGERFRFSAPTTERFDEAKLSAVDVY